MFSLSGLYVQLTFISNLFWQLTVQKLFPFSSDPHNNDRFSLLLLDLNFILANLSFTCN